MKTEHLVHLSIPGLRTTDISAETTPTLHSWARGGAIAQLRPTFPCVTSCVQTTMWTGLTPGEHGVIANGFYHRDRNEVEFWVGRNGVIAGEQIWDVIRAKRPGFTSAVWHVQNIKDAGADYIVTPAPIHEPGGITRPWCYSKPDGLYQRLVDAMGHFPLQNYWGPLAGIESTRWILDAAAWLVEQHAPNLHWIYIPHLDYAAQKFGPDSPEAARSLVELDSLLGEFARRLAETAIAEDVVFLVAGEYALTDVTGPVFPNRLLREAGLLQVREQDGAEHLDLAGSAAFAMVDHQLAHVYVRDRNPAIVAKCRELFANVPGVAGVYRGDARRDGGPAGDPGREIEMEKDPSRDVELQSGRSGEIGLQNDRCGEIEIGGDRRKEIGIDNDRSGEIILIAGDSHWFAYYWWLDGAAAPPFARTVDIHRKPGYDPVELFFDPATRGIPLDAALVKGSHGVPATAPRHLTALICSKPSDTLKPGHTYRDTDIKRISLNLMGFGEGATGTPYTRLLL